MILDPPLFVLWYDFVKWLLLKTEKLPKKVRFTLSGRIDNLALDIVEKLIEARYSKEKKELLRRADLNMEKLRVLLRISNELGYLDKKGYEFASKKLNEAGKMLGGWRKQQKELPS